MTQLLTGYKVDKPPIFSYINGRIYVTNDHDRVKVWDGLYGTMRDAGIAAPAIPGGVTQAAGNGTVGTHLVRYRYLDSTSPAGTYRSNAAASLSVAIATASTQGKLTFSVTSSGAGGNLIRSDDTKVDQIQLEMTAASGSIFYVVANSTIANSATTVDVNISDTSLIAGDLAATYDTNISSTVDSGQGHEQPPLGSIITQVKDFTFIGGFQSRTFTVGVSSGSTSVTGTGFSTLWTARMIRVAGDTAAYEIASATATAITLTKVYAGTTNAAAVITVFPKAPNRIYWSALKSGAQLPESFKVATRARDVLNGTGDTIRGMINWQGDLLICGFYSMERLIFVNDPGVGDLQAIGDRFGVWNQNCLVVVNQSLFGWGPNGVWVMRGGGPTWISQPIDLTTVSPSYGYMDVTKKDQFHSFYQPQTKSIVWMFVKTGETTPREGIAFDLKGGRWFRVQFRQGMDASINAADANGQYQAVLSDSTNGRTWYNTGAADGVPAASNGAYSIASSTSTSTMTVNESLPSATSVGGNLAGVILYRPSTGEEKVISSNTSSTITLGSAFATTIAAGESMYAGAIPFQLTSAWWGGDLSTKKRASLFLTFIPTTGGMLRVQIYQDYATSPATFTVADTAEWPLGVTKPTGSQTFVDVSMDPVLVPGGFVRIPMFMDFKRVLRMDLRVLSPAGTLQLVDANFVLASKDDTKRVTNE